MLCGLTGRSFQSVFNSFGFDAINAHPLNCPDFGYDICCRDSLCVFSILSLIAKEEDGDEDIAERSGLGIFVITILMNFLG